MIEAVIFDLDNTLLDFMNMKTKAVESAVHGMIEAGFQMERDLAKDKIFKILYLTYLIHIEQIFSNFYLS